LGKLKGGQVILISNPFVTPCYRQSLTNGRDRRKYVIGQAGMDNPA